MTMKAKCIDNSSCCPGEHDDLPLTVGREYEVLDRAGGIVVITDDLGQRSRFAEKRFRLRQPLIEKLNDLSSRWAPI